jgi:hypothetical protein
MTYGIWYMVYGIWYMLYAIWYIIYGICYMVYDIWYMVYGIWYIGCAARERLGIDFLAEFATQTDGPIFSRKC